ncbi:MAG: toxin-antitoxin system YwqK family antitoxin [Chitinophagales bacterium]
MLCLFLFIAGLSSCNGGLSTFSQDIKKEEKVAYKLFVSKNELDLRPNEGLVYHVNKPFTGTSFSFYHDEKTDTAEVIQYFNGKKHGYQKKWFEGNMLSFEAQYSHGKLNGKVKTWWKNSLIRSESNYEKGISQGLQLQWYKSGMKFKERNLVAGKEEGLQRAWRENGKIYNNYEAKNGRIFGLKRSSLCYELEDEIIQYKE